MNRFLTSISTPTLLLDKQRCLSNIQTMAEKAEASEVIFRPHFKTHQSLQVAQWFREAGTEAITVSSVRMAYYFAHDGWKDITIAFPLNVRELNEINELAGRVSLNILIENRDIIPFMEKAIEHPLGIFLKIDTGAHRTGVPAGEIQTIRNIINRLANNSLFQFRGLLTHAGHTYKTSSVKEILTAYSETLDALIELKMNLSHETEELILSIGDTPSCSLVDQFEGIDEIRPGNFVFYDLMQCHLGSCYPDQVAVMLAAPVVAKHPERNEIVVYGGAIHLSKEYIILPSGIRTYGGIVQFTETGWGGLENNCYVSGLSQEHGIIHADRQMMNRIRIGDLIGIIPVHSCLTANLMKGYLTLDGEEIDHMGRS